MSPFGFHITQNEEQEVAARSASAQCLTLINSNSRKLKYAQVLSIYILDLALLVPHPYHLLDVGLSPA